MKTEEKKAKRSKADGRERKRREAKQSKAEECERKRSKGN